MIKSVYIPINYTIDTFDGNRNEINDIENSMKLSAILYDEMHIDTDKKGVLKLADYIFTEDANNFRKIYSCIIKKTSS